MTEQGRAARSGPRRAFSEDQILDAALGLLDEGGVRAASIRNIAARVGVAPNAVYTYFPNKAAVVRGLVDRLLGEVDHDVMADHAQPWRERAEALALELRARLVAHPAAVRLMIGRPVDGPNGRKLIEHTLELFCDAGLDLTDAARASYLLIVYVFGSMALEVADEADPGQLPPEPVRLAARRQAVAATPAERFPLSAAVAETMAGSITAEQYLWGLHRLLDGLAAAAHAAHAATATPATHVPEPPA